MDVSVIDSVEGLHDVAEQLRNEPRVACDIEADGLFRYRAKVCVLQLSTESHAFVIDTLAAWDAAVMQPILGVGGPSKIIHDLSFDARLLREAGIVLGNVIDTSIAARFLGEKSLGLGSLLSSRLGVVVDKDRQKHDWSQRPLRDDDIDYLVGDVEHLFTLADRLTDELAQRDIAAEVATEVDYMLARALVEPTADQSPSWLKIKGAREQPPIVRAVLRELVLARDAEARRRDVPLFKVVGEDSLVAASLKRPTTPDAMAALGFRGPFARAAMDRFLGAIRKGVQLGDVPAEELVEEERQAAPTREQRNRWKQREAALKAWRAETAKARGVEPQVILPGHCLTDLVAADIGSIEQLATIAGIGSHRVERYGSALLQVLASSPLA